MDNLTSATYEHYQIHEDKQQKIAILSNSSHIWILSTWNESNATKKLDF